jgi:hypothetical protein
VKSLWSVIGGLFIAFVSAGTARASFTFNDIQYWVGTGSNRAAIAIDWSDGSTSPPALVWGFRWDGVAHGRDMLTAVVAADSRLYAKFGGPPGSENAIFGIGYDANNDGQFAIDDGTSFDSNGIAYTGPADSAVSTNLADYYSEGWFTGFWHYGVASSDPYSGGQWSDSQAGMASRTLADGAWDSWTFTPNFSFMAFAMNPTAAAPPPGLLLGDFNNDGRVDAADYDVWKSHFGSTTHLAADANGNGIVDAADYTIWRDHFSPTSGAAATETIGVAEPASVSLALSSLGALWLMYVFPRKEPV